MITQFRFVALGGCRSFLLLVTMCFLALFKNLTFKECVAAYNCAINSDDRELLFFASRVRAAALNCLIKAIAIISETQLSNSISQMFK